MSGIDRHDDEGGMALTPAERDALSALPREREPSRLLEERTVRALRGRGLLEGAGARRVRVPPGWRVAAAAASILLFGGGFGAGQWMAGREAERALAAERARGEAQAASLVRETGQAYVAALAALAGGDSAQSARGRAAARDALHAAAAEVVRLSPDDPVASGILAGLDRAREQAAPDTTATRKLVWF